VNTPHIHKDIIIAWANGAEIEYFSNQGKWVACPKPIWHAECTYRIKPNVVKARAWRWNGDPCVRTANTTIPFDITFLEQKIQEGQGMWVSDWFDIPLTE